MYITTEWIDRPPISLRAYIDETIRVAYQFVTYPRRGEVTVDIYALSGPGGL